MRVRALSRPGSRLLRSLALALLLGASLALRAGEIAAKDPGAEAQRFVSGFVAEADRLLLRSAQLGAPPDHELRRLLATRFDVETMSRIVLDDHWAAASREERAEFRWLFEKYLLATYRGYLGGLTGGRFEVLAARPRGAKGAQVRSRMSGAGGSPVFHIDWRLWQGDRVWRIVDVMVQGISLVKTYRSQFAALIGEGDDSLGRVLAALREKLVAEAH